jgi:hypothetical protein
MAETHDDEEVCCVCGRPAATYYPQWEESYVALPSCGSPRCELQMQAGMDDYHADAGDR